MLEEREGAYIENNGGQQRRLMLAKSGCVPGCEGHSEGLTTRDHSIEPLQNTEKAIGLASNTAKGVCVFRIALKSDFNTALATQRIKP